MEAAISVQDRSVMRVTFSSGLMRRQVVTALRELVRGVWRHCRVWISGRPYAFRTARPALEVLGPQIQWRFLRIGQFDQPECRQLLETAQRPGGP